MTTDIIMQCGACRKPLVQQDNGSYIACCPRDQRTRRGPGYWSNVTPLAKDAWWKIPRDPKTGLYLYQRIL